MVIQDKKSIIGLSIFLLIFLFGVFFILPGYKKANLLRKKIEIQELNLNKMLQFETELKNTKKNKGNINPTSLENFHIYSFLEQLASNRGIKDQVVSMKILKSTAEGTNSNGVTGDIAEVKLKNIRLNPLVDFLYDVEHSEYPLMINKISIRQLTGDPPLLDVVFLVGSYPKIFADQ